MPFEPEKLGLIAQPDLMGAASSFIGFELSHVGERKPE
jgi:hypothetical protein